MSKNNKKPAQPAKPAGKVPNNQMGVKPAPARREAPKGLQVDGTVSAALPRNTELTKPGPGRPKKPTAPGNFYRVDYFGDGRSAEDPQPKTIFAPDTSTAICKANELNQLQKTAAFQIRATLINERGEELDPAVQPVGLTDDGEDPADDSTTTDETRRENNPGA